MRHHPRPGRALRQGVPRRTVTALPPIMTRSASIRTLTYCDLKRGLRKRPGPPDRIRRARACHNAPDDGRVRLTRACTHKSLSRVRFRANRTSSRRRRTTESDPRRSLAGSKYRIAANPRKHWNELRLLQARGGNTAITSTSSRNPSRASRPTCTAVEGGGVSWSRIRRAPRGRLGSALLYR